ncbi:hypothetical protein B1C78_00455 [Thioalkalivibrio denitrificans]|uniref:Dynamin N-terminal domain-containing protein n=1 Tax=Thioalkalivibrio denitrificans TaxID=108003 RepID=A0A1V3NUS6_9GAMM|nr:dynamin family protein [Thioalkalivibrio denitrificans]OOG28840.1 hypothetical protein B1C78_00455 [Thioalkalivibrio denitrificans]
MTNCGSELCSQLSHWLDQACALEGTDREACATLRAKLAAQSFNLVVVGQFKRGKSTLINALLGAELLPVAVVPVTAVVTVLHYGETPSARVRFENGAERTIAGDTLADYVTEAANPRNVKGVREVVVQYPSPWLKEGIRLVDTPGIGSVHDHNTEVTYRYLPQADAVLLVISVDQPAGRAELDFLADIRRHSSKVFCLLNKADYLSPSELEESVAFTAHALAQAAGEPVEVFPISARLALRGKLNAAPEVLAESGLSLFAEALGRFLREEKGAVWERSMRHHLLRLLEQARLAAGLESRALTEPLERIEANLAAFATKKREAAQARTDFATLLAAEAKRLVKEKVEPDLEALKQVLEPRLQSALTAWYEDLRPQGSAALQQGLERHLLEAVQREFDAWRRDEDKEVSEVFAALCRRFWNEAQALADELVRYSADLFSLPFQATHTESLWQTRSGFQYKFWQEPPSLVLIGAAIARWLPRVIGHPLILRKARQRASELVEMQSGRLRHDFEERIKASAAEFRRDMLERLDATIAGIEAAVAKGVAVRNSGAEVAAHRLVLLQETLADIERLESAIRGE